MNIWQYYSQTKWSVPLKIVLMNWLFETWTRKSFQECNNELIIQILKSLTRSKNTANRHRFQKNQFTVATSRFQTYTWIERASSIFE